MTGDLLEALPARHGHFVLESGYHADLWLTLDALFVEPRSIGPLVAALAARLRPFGPSAVCGPLLGGAFLAQAVSHLIGARFYFAAITAAGASTVVVGSLFLLGDIGAKHFDEGGVPVETLGRRPFQLWRPDECPLCAQGVPTEGPDRAG